MYTDEQTHQVSLYLVVQAKFRYKPNQTSMCTARPPSLTLPALSPLPDESTEVIDKRAWTGRENMEVQCSPRQSLKHKTLQHTHRLDTNRLAQIFLEYKCYNNVWCMFQNGLIPNFTYRVNLLFYEFTVFLFNMTIYFNDVVNGTSAYFVLPTFFSRLHKEVQKQVLKKREYNQVIRCTGQYSSIYVLVLMFTLQWHEPVTDRARTSHDTRTRPACLSKTQLAGYVTVLYGTQYKVYYPNLL